LTVTDSSDIERFSGEIVVASRIVDTLSSGLYENPAACLKELINNSYDADATTVSVHVKPDADLILIDDNGTGMDREEFERNFERIAESHKRDDGDITAGGRKQIGKIGIGFIAANELCNVMEIESTKKGSTELLRVKINFEDMRKDPSERRRGEDGLGVAKGDYEGVVVTKADAGEHFTRIVLTAMSDNAREAMVAVHSKAPDEPAPSLYGLKPETVADRLALDNLRAWDELDLYSQTMLGVALNVPVAYPPEWIDDPFRSELRYFERSAAKFKFDVLYDGTSLRKPVVLHDGDHRSLLHTWKHKGNAVSARGYFFARQGALKPIDINGVLIRVRGAAVGGYDRDYLDFPTTTGPLFQDWISGEVWADDRLEEAMNIDRKTLRTTHPAFIELQQVVHAQLRLVLTRVRKELYGAGSEERRTARARRESERLTHVLSTTGSKIGRQGVREVQRTWLEPRPSATGANRETQAKEQTTELLRKYTVAEFYEVCIDAAAEVLDRAQLERFITALTRRLRQK
jgi:Histidine kinase-, DNA gyrase B-, and HSP90-like ATPase